MKAVAVCDLVVEVEKSVPELRVRLGRVNKLWERFPTVGYVGFKERGCEVFLFKVASDRASREESVELCEVLSKHAGLLVVEDGSSALSANWHIVGHSESHMIKRKQCREGVSKVVKRER